MYRAEDADPPAIVCVVGTTELRYHLSAIDDLHAMLKKHGDWMPLGSADEQKPAAEGTVEAWGRSSRNPVKGWYALKKGLRGRFGMYMPPPPQALGLAEVTHDAKEQPHEGDLAELRRSARECRSRARAGSARSPSAHGQSGQTAMPASHCLARRG